MNSASLSSFGAKSKDFLGEWLVTIFGFVICFALILVFAVLHPREAYRSAANIVRPGLLLIKPFVNSVLECFSYSRKNQDDLSPEAWAAGLVLIITCVLLFLVKTELRVHDYMHYLSAK